MALIECPECHKKISDECMNCPQCGYILNKRIKGVINSICDVFKVNKKYSFINNKIQLSSLQILALVCLICSFILNSCKICFARAVYSIETYVPVLAEITLSDFRSALAANNNYFFLWYIMIISILLSILSIILFNSKINKFKKKIIIYLPNIIYVITVLSIIILAINRNLVHWYTLAYSQFNVLWGAILILILSIVSMILLIIDIKSRKKQRLLSNYSITENLFCANCGNKLKENSIFCGKCGNKI